MRPRGAQDTLTTYLPLGSWCMLHHADIASVQHDPTSTQRAAAPAQLPVLFLGSIRLHVMCVGTIAGRKSTEGYVELCSITGITFYYFPVL